MRLFPLIFLFLIQTAKAQPVMPDAQTDGVEAVKSWALSRVKLADSVFKRTGGKRERSPKNWAEQIVYLIQADRFNDGDPSNNKLNLETAQINGDLTAIFDFHHGGDLKGIENRLDYIKDLGITTLWITPVLKHSGSYHGYCTTDPTDIDPMFGTKQDFRRLVREAHVRGIYVVMDVVVNHMCDTETTYGRAANHVQCAADLDHKNWAGEAGGSEGQGELKFSENFFKPLRSQRFFNRCGANTRPEMEGTGPAAVYGDFVDGMFDFDTRNPDFQKIFTNLYKYWIAYADIDGFRFDAAKHVTEDFVAYLSTETREYARSIGKKNFYVIGEIAGPSDWIGRRLGTMFTNPQNPGEHGNVPITLTNSLFTLQPVYEANALAPYPGLTAAFDFGHGGRAVDVLQNDKPPSSLEDQFKSDFMNEIASQGDLRLNWTQLEIHDWPRYASHNPKSMEKSILGIAYLAFAEETPIIYYGMEQGFNGDCKAVTMNLAGATSAIQERCNADWTDALSRQDMFLGGMTRLGSTVPEIDRLAYIGPPQPRGAGDNSDPYTNQDHKLYRSAKTFLAVRRSCNVLTNGTTTFRWVERNSNEGILAFSRNLKDESEALVVINTAWSERTIPDMKVTTENSVWRNILDPSEQVSSSEGLIHFNGAQISANTVKLFVPIADVGDFDSQISAYRCLR